MVPRSLGFLEDCGALVPPVCSLTVRKAVLSGVLLELSVYPPVKKEMGFGPRLNKPFVL